MSSAQATAVMENLLNSYFIYWQFRLCFGS